MTQTKLASLAREEVGRELSDQFIARFGARPRIFRAPGRVNLIGEHTDYNEGWVMPAAIGFSTWVAVAPRADRKLCVKSLNFGDERRFSMDVEASPAKHWTDYVLGVAHELKRSGHPVPGANLLIWGDVPLGVGLSSSASIGVATAMALLGGAEGKAARDAIALSCQRAENEFVGARCGIMDQFISMHGQEGCALMLDCRSLEATLVRIPEGVSIVIANTMVRHSISGGEYNTRRAECEHGLRLLRQWLPEIHALRDVSSAQLEQFKSELPAEIYSRCRHVVTENERVPEFAAALRAGELGRVGLLMRDSHRSLRNDYEVSCPELDAMVDLAARMEGTIGVRMTGGGFGGCTVNLVRNDAVGRFRAEVASGYKRVMGVLPQIYVTRAADGASEIVV